MAGKNKYRRTKTMSVSKFIVKRLLKVVDFAFSDYNKTLTIVVKPYKNGCRCPICGRRCKIICSAKDPRDWKDIPIHGIEVIFHYQPREIFCPTHGRGQEQIPWADIFSRDSYRLEYALVLYCQKMTQKAAGKLLNISRSSLSRKLHRIIKRQRDGHKIRGLRNMGVDEISYKKGKRYATVIYDLDKGKVIWVGMGKESDTLRKFLSTLSDYQRRQIGHVCCDMAQAYTTVIINELKTAVLVIDRFHVVKALIEAMDKVRKEEFAKLSKKEREAVRGLRWALFRNPLNRKPSDKAILKSLAKTNNRIYRAWLLKDEFEHFWGYISVTWAEKFAKKWCTRTLKSRLEPMRSFVTTLRNHLPYILPYVSTRLTNAKGEGINRLLRMVKNRASGFANLEAFIDLIMLEAGDVDIPGSFPETFRTI